MSRIYKSTETKSRLVATTGRDRKVWVTINRNAVSFGDERNVLELEGVDGSVYSMSPFSVNV